MRTVQRDGVTLAFHEAGGGPCRPMVLVHGWGCDHAFLALQQSFFAPTRRTIAVDLRGHGASSAPPDDYAVATMADDLAFLCRALGLQDAVLVGHSMGGLVGLDCAARHPGLAAAAVLIDSALFLPASRRDATRAVLDALAGPDWQAVLPRLADRFFLPGEDPPLKSAFLASLRATPRHVLIASLAGHTVDHDASTAATGCRCPLAYIAADPPLADLRRFRDLCPALRTAQTLGSGHFSPLVVPDQINAMLAGFERAAFHEPEDSL